MQAEAPATDVEIIAFILASFALEQNHQTEDLEWLMERFHGEHSIMQKAPIYQEILREGIEQGIEKGRLEATRHLLLLVTETRFPALAPLAQEQTTLIQTSDKIDALIVAISSAQNELKAQNALRGDK